MTTTEFKELLNKYAKASPLGRDLTTRELLDLTAEFNRSWGVASENMEPSVVWSFFQNQDIVDIPSGSGDDSGSDIWDQVPVGVDPDGEELPVGKGAIGPAPSGGGSQGTPATPEPHPAAHTTSAADVKGVYDFLGLSASDSKVNEIVSAVNSGERTLTDVRNDLMQYQADQAGAGTSIRDIAAGHIKQIFEDEGLEIATASETETERVDRLVTEVLEGYSGFGGDNMSAGRSFADIRNSLQQYKEDHGVVTPVIDDSGLITTPPPNPGGKDEGKPIDLKIVDDLHPPVLDQVGGGGVINGPEVEGLTVEPSTNKDISKTPTEGTNPPRPDNDLYDFERGPATSGDNLVNGEEVAGLTVMPENYDENGRVKESPSNPGPRTDAKKERDNGGGYSPREDDRDVKDLSVKKKEVKKEEGASLSQADEVRGVFKFLGLSKPDDERLNRIVGEINSGKRSLTDVRNDLMQWQAKQAGKSVQEVAAGYVKRVFKEEGASLATAKETEKERLDRLVGEVLEGHTANKYGMDSGRSFADIRKGIRGEGSTWKSSKVSPQDDDESKSGIVTKPKTKVVNKPKPTAKKPFGAGGEDPETQEGYKPATGKYSDTKKLEEERERKEKLQAASDERDEKAQRAHQLAMNNPTVGKVRKIFDKLGLPVSDGRLIRIAGEVDNGRSLADVHTKLEPFSTKAAPAASVVSSDPSGNDAMIVAAPNPNKSIGPVIGSGGSRTKFL